MAQSVLARVSVNQKRLNQIITNLKDAADGKGILEAIDFAPFAEKIKDEGDDVSPSGGSGRIAHEFKKKGIRSLEGNWRARVAARLSKGSPTITIAVTHALLEIKGVLSDRGQVVFNSIDQGYSSATIHFEDDSKFPFRRDSSGNPAKGSPWAFVPAGIDLVRSGGPGTHMTDKLATHVRMVILPEMRAKIRRTAKAKFD
jgi:hypothetical protein